MANSIHLSPEESIAVDQINHHMASVPEEDRIFTGLYLLLKFLRMRHDEIPEGLSDDMTKAILRILQYDTVATMTLSLMEVEKEQELSIEELRYVIADIGTAAMSAAKRFREILSNLNLILPKNNPPEGGP